MNPNSKLTLRFSKSNYRKFVEPTYTCNKVDSLVLADVPAPWAALYQELYIGLRDGKVSVERPGNLVRGTEPLLESLRRLVS